MRALVLFLLALPAFAATPVASVQIVASPNGKLLSQFPAGDGPPDPIELTWDATCLTAALNPILTKTVGDAQSSVNVRTCLSGTESATASIVLTQQTGSTASSYFTEPLTGNNLVFSCSAGAGSGTWRIRAVYAVSGGVSSVAQYGWACNTVGGGGDLSDNANPGIYWQNARSGQSLTQSYRCNTVWPAAFTKGNSTFKGAQVQYYWSDLEVGAGGYQVGIDHIKAEIDCLSVDPNNGQSYNPARRLIVGFREEKRNTGTNCTEIYPAYVCSASTGGASWDYSGFGVNSIGIRWDIPEAKAAYFNMLTGLINGLKADTARWAMIEGFRLHQETGGERYGVNVTTAEYTAFQIEYAELVRTLAPDKAIFVNPTGGLSDKVAYLAAMKNIDVLLGHGDMLPCGASGNTEVCGPNDGLTFTANAAGADKELTGNKTGFTIDYSDVSRLWAAAEGSELGQCAFETYQLQDIWDYINDYLSVIYFIIDASDQTGLSSPCTLPYTGTHPADDADHASNINSRKTFFHANPTLDTTSLPPHYP